MKTINIKVAYTAYKEARLEVSDELHDNLVNWFQHYKRLELEEMSDELIQELVDSGFNADMVQYIERGNKE